MSGSVGPGVQINRQLTSIQYLRALAACSVVVHHALDQFSFQINPPFMQAGVDLFFVISGFLMIAITADKPTRPGAFLAQRVVRICPTYWFFTLVTVVLAIGVPGLFHAIDPSVWNVTLSMLFVPHLNPALVDSVSPLVRIGWTLNYEMFFYLLFAATLPLPFRLRLPALTTAFALLTFGGAGLTVSDPAAFFYSRPIVLEFLAGSWIGFAYVRGWFDRIPAFAAATVAVASLLLLPLAGGHMAGFGRLFCFGLPASLILIAALGFEVRRTVPAWAPLRAAGDWSYSIYLTHLFGIAVLRALWSRAGLPTSGDLGAATFVAAALPLALMSGWVSYRLIERPSLRRGRKLVARLTRPAAPSPNQVRVSEQRI